MITLRSSFGETVTLNRGRFSVPESPELESLLNTAAHVFPVMNAAAPDKDFALVQNLAGKVPALTVISNDAPMPNLDDSDDSKIY